MTRDDRLADPAPLGTQGPQSAGSVLLPIVEERLADVGRLLNEATGGGALCRIDGTGGSAKAYEGAMAALLDVRRLLRRAPGADLGELRARWHNDLESRRARGSVAAWLEYLSAGVEELDRLISSQASAPAADPCAQREEHR